MAKLFVTISALALLSGCAGLDAVDELLGTSLGEVAEKETYERLEDYCRVRGTNLAGRQETIDRLNSYDDPTDGPGPFFVAQDCDGDFFPDLPTGQPE